MLKLIHLVLLLIGVASAAQTRIKIGSSSWGYQIEQGPNVRTEFASDDGVASGFYQFRVGNETKKLEYRIDPNSREPDISFNVVNVDDSAVPPSPSSPAASSPSDADKEEVSTTTTTASTADPAGNNSTSTTNSPTTSSNNNSTSSNEVVMSSSSSRSPSSSVSSSNMTFDSIDSKQDFKGHVTLKVGNSTYTINFVTGDKAHTREETLLPSGMMFGRFSYLLQSRGSSSSPNKLVINYKFNSTSPDPTFEVSLYKTIESEPPSSGSGSSHFQPPTTPRDGYSRQVSYPARDRYNSIHHHQQPSSSVSSPIISPSSSSGSSSSAIPSVRSQQQHYAALAEKYRERVAASQQQAGGGGGGVVPPNWYYNRGKPVIYDP